MPMTKFSVFFTCGFIPNKKIIKKVWYVNKMSYLCDVFEA